MLPQPISYKSPELRKVINLLLKLLNLQGKLNLIVKSEWRDKMDNNFRMETKLCIVYWTHFVLWWKIKATEKPNNLMIAGMAKKNGKVFDT